jgi:N-acetylglutamate synthase-like GNAT family acetyltransferase
VHACSPLDNGKLRRGTAQDSLTLAGLIMREGMNPLLGDPRSFLVYETSDGFIAGCGNIRGNELASLVVSPAFRRQGIASMIVKELLDANASRDVFLLCLDSRAAFYERFGFRICPDSEISTGMRMEKSLGNVVAPLIVPGSACIAMRRVARDGDLESDKIKGQH